MLYRRQMARVGCALAERLRAAALVTGDSLGQVSSQTLPNMTAVDDASELPILRPLLSFDKREVMAKAASIGILALSELAADDACPLFAGGKQRTAVPRPDILEAEAQLDLEALAEVGGRDARGGSSPACSWTGSSVSHAPNSAVVGYARPCFSPSPHTTSRCSCT